MTTNTGTTYSTVEAARALGVPYGQVRWLVETGVIAHEPVKQGLERKFTDHDLWMIDLAAKLRQAGLRIKQIKSIKVISILPYKNAEVLYIQENKKHTFAAYWDTKNWMVVTGLYEIVKLRDKVKGLPKSILITDKEEVNRDERPNP